MAVGTAAAQQAEQEKVVQLEPLIIYGAKDANTLNDTSASVGVTTAEDIENFQIRTFRDAFRRLANVMDADWNDAGFVIRGVSSEGFVPGGAPVASLYVDGILQTTDGTRRGARGLWDVEQVEVYRGPQSTQSGRAAMAGAIYIKTKDPTFEKEAEISGTVGTNNLVGTAFMVNMPLVDNQLAIRMSGSFERSKSDLDFPTYEQFNRYEDLTTDLNYNIRGKILFQPSEMPETRALLSYSFTHDAPVTHDIGSGPGFKLDDDRGDFNIPAFTEQRSTRVHNVGLEVTHEFSDKLRLTSLTGLTNSYTERPSVNQGTPGQGPGPFNVVDGDQDDLLFTQEVRLNYEGDKVTWVGGLYGSYQNYETTFDRTFNSVNDYNLMWRETTNLAAFGEFTYEFVPSWKITAGGRLDYADQHADHLNTRTTLAKRIVEYSTDIEEFNFVPKIGISKDFGEFHTAGLTYSQGFRAGGYGLRLAPANSPLPPEPYYYDPEKASSYELFYKGRFLDERLTLNANAFYTEYTDQQVEFRLDPNDPFSRVITNAASSRAYGFEIEPNFQVTDQFSAFASIGYTNTQFKDFKHFQYGDVSGEPFPEAPEWTVGVGGHYIFENGFYVGADAKYTSSYFARFGTPPRDEIDARVIVNAQAGYKSEKWEINAFVENLLDERYYTFLDHVGANDFATLGAGRTFGLNVKAKF